MRIYDAVVVGGGPVGCAAAEVISGKGYDVLVMEEHKEIGRPVQCAGIVTPRILDMAGISDSCVLNEVRGANIYPPDGNKLVLDAGKTKALIIDRAMFDRQMAEKAVRSGSTIWLNTKFLDGKRKRAKNGAKDGCALLKIRRDGAVDNIGARIVIGADGIQSSVAKRFGLPYPGAANILPGFEAELSPGPGGALVHGQAHGADGRRDGTGENAFDREFVNLYLGGEVAPGFFGWAIPTDNALRVGLCVWKAKRPPYHYFRELLKNDEFKGWKPVAYFSGAVPIGVLKKTYGERVMTVGDAAAQVKPLTGGGVYTGLRCAKHCGDTGVAALEAGDFSERFLGRYQKAWTGDIGAELKRSLKIRLAFLDLDDRKINEAFEILRDPEILSLLTKKGDIDFPSKLYKTVLKKAPKLIKFSKILLKSLL